MKVFCKRIKNIPFMLIHYLALLYMPYFLLKVNVIEEHVFLESTEFHMTNATDLILTARALFAIAVVLYLTKTIAGYLGSMLLMSINSATFGGLFDFGCDCVSDEYKEVGRQYIQNVERVGGNIVTIIKIILLLAIVVLVKQYIADKIKNKNMLVADKEIVNPELAREGSDFESSGYLLVGCNVFDIMGMN